MTDEEKRRWAVEQAVRLHRANGVSTDVLIGEAKKLLEFIKADSK